MKKSAKPTAKRGKRKKGGKVNPLRMFMRRFVLMTAVAYVLLSVIGGWYVSHTWQWISDKRDDWPRLITGPLEYFGDRAVMVTDGLGFTGQDAVYDLDEPAPSGSVFFAGPPVRI